MVRSVYERVPVYEHELRSLSTGFGISRCAGVFRAVQTGICLLFQRVSPQSRAVRYPLIIAYGPSPGNCIPGGTARAGIVTSHAWHVVIK